MSYNAKEISDYGGNPVYLYRFTRDATNYDYCSLPEDLVLAGTPSGTFVGSSLKHGRIGVGLPARKDSLDVVFPLSDEFAKLFLKKHTRFLPTTITIWRGHLDDVDGEFIVIFKGKVRSGKPVSQTQIALTCASLFASVKRTGMGMFAHPSCRHPLYFGRCRLSKATFEAAGTVSAVSGTTVTVAEAAAQADGYYSGGILEFGGSQTLILNHTGTSLQLRAFPDNLEDELTTNGSAAVTIAPGCNRSINDCRDKFNNVVNFGGFPYMPQGDPWNDGRVA